MTASNNKTPKLKPLGSNESVTSSDIVRSHYSFGKASKALPKQVPQLEAKLEPDISTILALSKREKQHTTSYPIVVLRG